MSKALTTIKSDGNLITFNTEQVELIKRTVAKGATDDELKLFLYQAQKTGLDPLARQIYFQKRRAGGDERVTIITGIDGYRLTADRTGKYAGQDDPVFDDENEPRKASVTVYKLVGGVRCPFTATARWNQYYPGDNQGFMWRKMPHHMLSKCAEALALRKAFPAELSGVFVKEEMEQAGEVIEIQHEEPQPEPPKPKAPAATYSHADLDQNKTLADLLRKRKIDESLWDTISSRLNNKPWTALSEIVPEVLKEYST